MYLQVHIYKNIPLSFDFITTWNQGVFLCSPCVIICGLSGCIVFVKLSHKRQNYREKRLLNIKYIFWFSRELLCEILTVNKRNHTYGRAIFWCENEFNLIVLCYIYSFRDSFRISKLQRFPWQISLENVRIKCPLPCFAQFQNSCWNKCCWSLNMIPF